MLITCARVAASTSDKKTYKNDPSEPSRTVQDSFIKCN